MDYKIIIAGGGLAGMTMARMLGDIFIGSDAQILLVDRAPIDNKHNDIKSFLDERTTALAPTTVNIYRNLGLWAEIEPIAEAICSIHVSDKGHIAQSILSPENSMYTELGHVVENEGLRKVLLAAVKQHPNITLLGSSLACEPRAIENGYQLSLKSISGNAPTMTAAEKVTASLLIIADGTQSSLRDQLGIETESHSYRQHAVVVNIETSKPHKGIAFERFLPDGALACLPLTSVGNRSRSGIVWSIPEDTAATVRNMSSDEFVQAIQSVLGWRLGDVVAVGSPAMFPLTLTQSKELYRSNLIVAGNAAHTLHPVAGQGFNLIARESWALRLCLQRALNTEKSIGASDVLAKYIDSTEKDRLYTIKLCHALMNIFGNQRLSMQLLRSVGLTIIDNCSVLRSAFIKQMSGLNGMAEIANAGG